MSETAQTLIKAGLRSIGVIASGETPTHDELDDGLEALKIMLRHWSAKKIRLYYTETDTITLTGAESYTIGSGGTCNTVRPTQIRGAYVRNSIIDSTLRIIDEDQYRNLSLKSVNSTPAYLWYNPEYPLGVIYIYPAGTGMLYLDSVKPLTEPSGITSDISFPPEYDEAIKYGVAIRMAPEYGKEPSPTILGLYKSAMDDIEMLNFAAQVNAVRPEIIKISSVYNINEG
jgi:hypothetical protein